MTFVEAGLRQIIAEVRVKAKMAAEIGGDAGGWWTRLTREIDEGLLELARKQAANDDTRPPAADAGEVRTYREGVEASAAYHDAKAAKWRKEAERHVRPGGFRSDCQNRDLERAKMHEDCAAAIRKLGS